MGWEFEGHNCRLLFGYVGVGTVPRDETLGGGPACSHRVLFRFRGRVRALRGALLGHGIGRLGRRVEWIAVRD